MSALPKSWAKVTLEDCCEVIAGQSPPGETYNENGIGMPFYQGKAEFGDLFPSPRKWCDQPTKIARGGDILVSVRAPVGPTNLSPGECCIGRGLAALRPKSGVQTKFVLYQMRATESALAELATGSTFAAVSSLQVRNHEFVLAPTNEQCRIVAKIEELFSELDKGVESLTTAQRQLTAHKQSLLDRHFASACELKPLPLLLNVPMSNGYSGKPVKGETPFRVLSLSATTGGVFEPQHFKYLDEAGLEQRDIWCEPEDILVQRGNTAEYVGVPAIYTGEANEFIFPDLMIRLRADRDQILPKYLYYALSSPSIRNYLRAKAKGSAGSMPKINQTILSSVQIPYRALREQDAIIQKLDEEFSSIAALEQTLDEQSLRSSALRQAILRRAFSGLLVAQDPADEPASVLLQRIRAEREEGSTKKQRNNKNGKKEAA